MTSDGNVVDVDDVVGVEVVDVVGVEVVVLLEDEGVAAGARVAAIDVESTAAKGCEELLSAADVHDSSNDDAATST